MSPKKKTHAAVKTDAKTAGSGKSIGPQQKPTPRSDGWYIVLAVLAVVILIVIVFLSLPKRPDQLPFKSELKLADIRFDGEKAYQHLKQLCDIGPRSSGSPGMAKQQDLLEDHFKRCGAEVIRQEFTIPDPRGLDVSVLMNSADDETAEYQGIVPMTNLIARWKPDRKKRILFCAHYDTLPFPMLDPVDPKGEFVGANDGASGVALLMQMAESLEEILSSDQKEYGVDIVLFDGEEYIFDQSDKFFHGSEYFARQYAEGKLPYDADYVCGVLVDMIGDSDLQIYFEENSFQWDDTRPLIRSIWSTANRLGVNEFIAKPKYEIRDDHLPLHEIGGIACCDIIDFDYPEWHTRDDRPEQCSPESLAKVGWVLEEWLHGAE